MACPLDCSYLMEARRHEVPPIADPAQFPNPDIQVSEGFLRSNEPLLIWTSMALLRASLKAGVVDADVRDAIASLVTAYRMRNSGLVYDTRPVNPLAAQICDGVEAALEDFRKQGESATGKPVVTDDRILIVMAFLQRLEIQRNNGRRRGRAFVDFLRTHFPAQPAPLAADEAPTLLV